MSLVIQKYGGSSLATPERIKNVAKRIVQEARSGNQLVIVVSAIGQTTDHLLKLAGEVCTRPPERELDMLLSVGERTSIALLAMAIHELGENAISFTGSQVGIITDSKHTEAQILEVRAMRLREELDKGKIVIVAGFQGVSIDREITTLGRGGSDTTAIALAAALKADRCDLMKDVDGVFVADPCLIPDIRLNEEISYDEMIEMASLGSGVVKATSVELAKSQGVKIRIGSSFNGKIGTIITDRSLENARLTGIVQKKDLILLRVETSDFTKKNWLNRRFAEARIKTFAYSLSPDLLDIVLEKQTLPVLENLLTQFAKKYPGVPVQTSDGLGLVACIGSGLNFGSTLSEKIFKIFEDFQTDIRLMQVSPLRITCFMPMGEVETAVRQVHRKLIDYI